MRYIFPDHGIVGENCIKNRWKLTAERHAVGPNYKTLFKNADVAKITRARLLFSERLQLRTPLCHSIERTYRYYYNNAKKKRKNFFSKNFCVRCAAALYLPALATLPRIEFD